MWLTQHKYQHIILRETDRGLIGCFSLLKVNYCQAPPMDRATVPSGIPPSTVSLHVSNIHTVVKIYGMGDIL